MKKRFSVSVMAHDEREEFFPYLRDRLGDVPFFIDTGRPGDPKNLGVWGNCRRSWLAYDPKAEWHFVIQDDSILCRDFHERIENLLARLGDQDFVISLYAGARYQNKAAAAIRLKRPYIIGNTILNENALGMRTKHIRDMVEYCDSRGAETDRYIQSFARRRSLLIYAPIPSPVDHRIIPSLYRKLYDRAYPDSPRSAVWFADDKCPVIELGLRLSMQERTVSKEDLTPFSA